MDLMLRRRMLMAMQAVRKILHTIASATGLVSFSTQLAEPLESCVCEVAPVQSGTGDPSPTNIRPITGWTGLNVLRTSINVWNEQWANGYWNHNDNGAFVANASYVACQTKIPVKPSTSYFWYCPKHVREVQYYDVLGNLLSYETFSKSQAATSFTTPANCYFIAFYMGATYGSTYANNISINYPATETAYHAYSGTIIPISWQSTAGTVYGGSLDVVSGVLTVTWGYIADLGANARTWSYRNGCFDTTISGGKLETYSTGLAKAVCSAYVQAAKTFAGLTSGAFAFGKGYVNSSTCSLIVKDTNYTTSASFKSSMSGVSLAYELKTPTTYQLTPAEVSALIGSNTVWHDGNGSISVGYYDKT